MYTAKKCNKMILTAAAFIVFLLGVNINGSIDTSAAETAFFAEPNSNQASETVIRRVISMEVTPAVSAVGETNSESGQTASVNETPESVPTNAPTEVPITEPTPAPTATTAVPTAVPHTHSYVATVTTPATCTANGVRTYICSCGSSYTEAIPAAEHNYVQTASVNATCDTDGSVVYTCSICGDAKAETIPATGHAWITNMEKVYVVDVPAWDEPFENHRDEEHWYCNVCGFDFTAAGYSIDELYAHEEAHVMALEGGGYHNGVVAVPFMDVAHHPEEGHYELEISQICSKCGVKEVLYCQ